MAETTTERAVTASFVAQPESLRRARHFVGDALRGWACDPAQVVGPSVFLANELVTNAIVHAGGSFDLTVRLQEGRVRIEVRDASPAVPRVVPWEDVATEGRGLHLVDAMAAGWGTEPAPHGAGKVVWCELPRGGADRTAG